MDTFQHLLEIGHWTYEMRHCRYGQMGKKPLTMDIVPFEYLSLELVTWALMMMVHLFREVVELFFLMTSQPNPWASHMLMMMSYMMVICACLG
jgi:hypothetical protein